MGSSSAHGLQRKAGSITLIRAALFATVKKTDTRGNAPSENAALQVTWLRLIAVQLRHDTHQAEAKAKEGSIRQSWLPGLQTLLRIAAGVTPGGRETERKSQAYEDALTMMRSLRRSNFDMCILRSCCKFRHRYEEASHSLH